MAGRQAGGSPSYFVRAMWWLALILAGMAAFLATGPAYEASIAWAWRYTAEHYGHGLARLIVFLWGPIVAALVFLSTLAGLITGFMVLGFTLGNRL